MTILHYFVTFIVWAEIIGVALFLAACAVGVGLWGHATWIGRGKYES